MDPLKAARRITPLVLAAILGSGCTVSGSSYEAVQRKEYVQSLELELERLKGPVGGLVGVCDVGGVPEQCDRAAKTAMDAIRSSTLRLEGIVPPDEFLKPHQDLIVGFKLEQEGLAERRLAIADGIEALWRSGREKNAQADELIDTALSEIRNGSR